MLSNIQLFSFRPRAGASRFSPMIRRGHRISRNQPVQRSQNLGNDKISPDQAMDGISSAVLELMQHSSLEVLILTDSGRRGPERPLQQLRILDCAFAASIEERGN